MTENLDFDRLYEQFEALRMDNEVLSERLSDVATRVEDVGWTQLFGSFEDEDAGFTLDQVKQFSDKLRPLVVQSPLMKRGAQLRHGYIFGRGMTYSNVPPRVQKVIDEPNNHAALFSTTAWQEMNLAKFSDGNFFVVRKITTNNLTRVPLSQITAVITDPDSSERIWFIQRTWSTNDGEPQKAWYPMHSYTGPKRSRIKSSNGAYVPVDNTSVIYHSASNKQVGWTFGVPDGLAALAWALAYDEYLRNNAKLVRAFATIAFKLSSNTKAGQNNAAAQIALPGGIAGTAVQGPGTDLSAMPRSGSDVDFSKGQPIAAMVAASFGVSVIALLSSPGATGGSYGAAQTLDSPTIRVMASEQDAWLPFLRMILWDMGGRRTGANKTDVVFPSIETDEIYRQVQSLMQAYTTGAIHQQEYRTKMIDILDIVEPVAGLPKPDMFNAGADPNDPTNNAPSQGNTGVGNPNSNVSNHDNDSAKP